MKKLILVFALMGVSTSSLAGKVEMDVQSLLIRPTSSDVKTLWRVKQKGGSTESHAREGRPEYRGVPWNWNLRLSDDGVARLVFWIDDKDTWFKADDTAIIDKTFDMTLMETHSINLFTFDDSTQLRLLLTPIPVEPELEEAPLTALAYGLNFMCMKNSAVVVDENFYLGSATGFGEKLVVGIPGLALVNMSFTPIHNWTPIGTYYAGVIEVPLEGGHLLSVLNVGIGPKGFSSGGPFTIYGAIGEPENTVEEARELLDFIMERDGKFSGERLEIIKQATRNNPYGHMGRLTIGTDSDYSEHLKRGVGRFGKGLPECSK